MNKSGRPLLSRSYHIPLSMFDDAFRNFQKKYVYPQNIFISVIFLAIAGVYVHAAVKDNTQTLAYLLIAVCLGLVTVRWYRTFKLRRSVHEALKDVEQDTYELNVYEEGMVIRTMDAPQPDYGTEEAPAAEPEEPEDKAGNGFQQLFPEEPVQRDPVPPTELPFGTGMKLLEFPEYFMAYVVKQNFYVIPKKDFSDEEIAQLKQLFHL